jgi:hypothetical protein
MTTQQRNHFEQRNSYAWYALRDLPELRYAEDPIDGKGVHLPPRAGMPAPHSLLTPMQTRRSRPTVANTTQTYALFASWLI